MARHWRKWLVKRFGLAPIAEKVLHRRVPKAPWYYGDGATLMMLFGILVITGMAMSLTYEASIDGAYQSVRYITEVQTLGWLVRGIHYWSAGLMVVMIFAHLFRQILVGGYKFPREGTWLVGVVLFFLVLTMAFTGYVLRWDERGVYAAIVVLNMFQHVPLIGGGLVEFVAGGREIGAMTLTRIYAVHVVILPMLLAGLIGLHLYLVIIRGITAPSERGRPIRSVEEQEAIYKEAAASEELGEPFYPHTAFKSGRMAMGVFLLVIVLTLVFGPGVLYPEANLISPSMPAEEWWFWWYSGLIALIPATIAPWVIVLFPIVIFLVLVALPFLDRGPFRGMKKRPLAVVAVLVSVGILLFLTDQRWESPWTGWPSGEPPPVPEFVEISPMAEEGRQLFAAYGCNSCHAVAGVGPRVAVDIADIAERRSREEMRSFIVEPPENIAMPAYGQRLTDEEIERLVDFVHTAQLFRREQ